MTISVGTVDTLQRWCVQWGDYQRLENGKNKGSRCDIAYFFLERLDERVLVAKSPATGGSLKAKHASEEKRVSDALLATLEVCCTDGDLQAAEAISTNGSFITAKVNMHEKAEACLRDAEADTAIDALRQQGLELRMQVRVQEYGTQTRPRQ